MLVFRFVDGKCLEGAAKLSTLGTAIAGPGAVLALDVQEEVGALHDHLTDGALPVRGAFDMNHLGLDRYNRARVSEEVRRRTTKKRQICQKYLIAHKEGSVSIVDMQRHGGVVALQATKCAAP